MTPLPADHHAIAARFGIDLCGTAYGQTETGHGAFALIDELPGRLRHPAELWRGKSKAEILDFAPAHGYPVFGGDVPLRRGLMGKPTTFLEAAILGPDDEPLPARALRPARVSRTAARPAPRRLSPPARGHRRGDARRLAPHRRRGGARRRRPLLLRRSHGRIHPQQGREHLVVRGRGAGQRSSGSGDERGGRRAGARRARGGRGGLRGAARRRDPDAATSSPSFCAETMPRYLRPQPPAHRRRAAAHGDQQGREVPPARRLLEELRSIETAPPRRSGDSS